MTPTLPFTGIPKIDAALTDAWQRRLSIRIKATPVAPLFDGVRTSRPLLRQACLVPRQDLYRAIDYVSIGI